MDDLPSLRTSVFAAKSVTHQAEQRRSGGNVDLPRFSPISPNGRELAFSWRGDRWKVAPAGG